MQKYRVLKQYPKQITNSGRLITLKPGGTVYLKHESQVLRLVQLGFIAPIVELPSESKIAPKVLIVDEDQPSQSNDEKRKSKADYLNKK